MQSLAALTTLRVGGPARNLRTATSAAELVEAVTALDGAAEPLLLVAGGSNLLVADEGFDGTVVRVATAVVVVTAGAALVVLVRTIGPSRSGCGPLECIAMQRSKRLVTPAKFV